MHSCLDFSHEATTDSRSSRDTMKLAPMPDSYDLDRGLLLAVQAIQVRIVKWFIKAIMVESSIYTSMCEKLTGSGKN